MTDLNNSSGTYAKLLNRVLMSQNIFESASFSGQTAKVVRITLERTNPDYYPHLREWELYTDSATPAVCGSPQASQNFNVNTTATGVTLYERPASCSSNEYVQVVDLSQGANVVSIVSNGTSNPVSCGATTYENTTYFANQLGPEATGGTFNWWDYFGSRFTSVEPFSVINGAFFSTSGQITFPAKDNNYIPEELTFGYGWNVPADADAPKRALVINGVGTSAVADVVPYDELNGCPNPNIFNSGSKVIVGFTPDVPKGAEVDGRTFAGVVDCDGNGQAEKIIFYSTNCSSRSDAVALLQGFGVNATEIVQFDGGGSSQLVVGGTYFLTTDNLGVGSSRAVAHAFGIYAPSGSSNTSPHTQESTSALTIYPNPAPQNGQWNIVLELPAEDRVTLTLRNDKGLVIWQNQANQLKKGTHTFRNLSLQDLPKGIYYIQAKSAHTDLNVTQRLMIGEN
jgi:hypothetical protein